jgi:hypothetical protein
MVMTWLTNGQYDWLMNDERKKMKDRSGLAKMLWFVRFMFFCSACSWKVK